MQQSEGGPRPLVSQQTFRYGGRCENLFPNQSRRNCSTRCPDDKEYRCEQPLDPAADRGICRACRPERREENQAKDSQARQRNPQNDRRGARFAFAMRIENSATRREETHGRNDRSHPTDDAPPVGNQTANGNGSCDRANHDRRDVQSIFELGRRKHPSMIGVRPCRRQSRCFSRQGATRLGSPYGIMDIDIHISTV